MLRAVDKLDRLGVEGVRLLLGEGRLDESGAFTKGAGLVGARRSTRCWTSSRRARAGVRIRWRRSPMSSAVRPRATQGLEELAKIDAALKSLGVADDQALFEPSIVRGLEYYTGAVFEAELLLATTDDKGQPVRFGSIGGGGRYDDLVARFTGQRDAGHRLLVRRLAPGGGPAGGGARARRRERAGRW